MYEEQARGGWALGPGELLSVFSTMTMKPENIQGGIYSMTEFLEMPGILSQTAMACDVC